MGTYDPECYGANYDIGVAPVSHGAPFSVFDWRTKQAETVEPAVFTNEIEIVQPLTATTRNMLKAESKLKLVRRAFLKCLCETFIDKELSEIMAAFRAYEAYQAYLKWRQNGKQ